MLSAVSVLQNISPSALSPGSHSDLAYQTTTPGPFAGFLEQAAQQVNQLRTDADTKVRGLMTGDGTDIHTAMIATQKADLAFDLALSVRNKAVGAYQQLMNMQF